jgi:hypothetical protein
MRNGMAVDANGNPVPTNTPEAHIPTDEFEFNPSERFMMDFDTWSSGILEALREFGDLEHQRRLWGKTSNVGDTFIEACERLYDDFDLPGFERTWLPRLSNREAIEAELAALKHELDLYEDLQPESTIINSEKWPVVVERARRAYALLRESVDGAKTPKK